MLFEVAILERPTKKKKDEGVTEKLILAPTAVVAPDEKTAAIIGSRKADLDKVAPDRMEVLVRPFCGCEPLSE